MSRERERDAGAVPVAGAVVQARPGGASLRPHEPGPEAAAPDAPRRRGGSRSFDLVRSSLGPRGWLFVVWMPVASVLAVALGGGVVVLLKSAALVEHSMLAWVALFVVPTLWFTLLRVYSLVLLPSAALVIEPDSVRLLDRRGAEIIVMQRQSLVVRRCRISTHGKWWTNCYAALALSDGATSVVIHADAPADADRSFGEEAPDVAAYATTRSALHEILAALGDGAVHPALQERAAGGADVA